jgi:methyl-accepting chemotaxis protein
MKRFITIKGRILLIVFTSFILFSLLVSGIGLYHSSSLIKSESEEKLMNLVRVQARSLDAEFVRKVISSEVIERFVKGTLDTEKLLSEEEYIVEYKKKIEPLIYALALQNRNAWFYFNPEIKKKGQGIWFAEDSAGVLQRMPEEDIGDFEDRMQKSWFFDAKDKQSCIWTNPYPSLAFKDVFWVTYSCPVYMDGEFIGVGGHDFYFSELKESLKAISIFGNGYAFLMNEDFDFLIHPDADNQANLKDVDQGRYEWMTRFIEENETGILEYQWHEEEPGIMAYSHLSNNWVIGITADYRVIYKPLFSQVRFQVIIILMGLIAFYILLHGLTVRITGSLENLIQVITHIETGDYASPVPAELLGNTTEIGVLAGTVEQMRVLQNQSIEKIRRYNSVLEKKVEGRTLELEESRNELELSLELLKSTRKKYVESRKFEATSRFLMEFAHRLNTPLGNVRMAVSFMEQNLQNWLNSPTLPLRENSSVFLNNLNESSRIASTGILNSVKIIRNLQDIARGFETQEAESINLKESLQRSIQEFRYHFDIAEPGNIQLECGENIIIHTFPLRLKQLIHNLLSYSIKYSINPGEEFVINLIAQKEGNQLILEFRDTSHLSYKELKERIFEPFSVSSFKNDDGGMEMHLIYSLVKVGLGGDIDCLESHTHPYYKISLPVDMD